MCVWGGGGGGGKRERECVHVCVFACASTNAVCHYSMVIDTGSMCLYSIVTDTNALFCC